MSARTLRIAQFLARTADRESRINGILSKPQFKEVGRDYLEDLATADPTGEQGAFIDWIFKNVKLLKDPSKKIRWPEDKERTRQALQFFKDLKPGDRTFYGIPQDINQLDLRALEAFKRQVHGHPDLPEFSGAQGLPEGASPYAHEGGYEIVKVGGPGVDPKLAIQAACALGQGTEWCTREEEPSKSYLKRGPLFVIYKDNKPYAQFHHGKDNATQLMDIADEEISMDKDEKLYDLLYELKLMPAAMYEFESLAYERKSRVYTKSQVKGTPEQEAEIAKSPQYAFAYANQILGDKPFSLGEPAIAKIPALAYEYAFKILNGKFPLGEPAIAKDPEASYSYARQVLDNKPFPLGEPAIAKNPQYSVYYGKYVLHGRFPLGEPTIAESGLFSYLYALDVLRKRRFPPGEPAIAKEPSEAARYAEHILKDPDPKTWGQRYLAEHSVAASRVRKRHHTQGARF